MAREGVAGQIKTPQPDAESKKIRDGPSHSRRVLVRLKFVVDGPARKPIQIPKKAAEFLCTGTEAQQLFCCW